MTVFRALFCCTLLALIFVPVLAQEADEKAPPKRLDEMTPEEQQKLTEEMMRLAQPGPEHELLKQLVGEWSLVSKVWHTEDGEPEVHPGTGSNRLILGGRFLEMSGRGTMFGEPVETLTILGFDRRKEMFTSTGYDTFGTYSVFAAGPYDAAKKQTRMSGTDDDPTTGWTQRYDFVLVWVDADTYRFEVWFKDLSHGNSEPFKMVETTGTRAKK